MTSYFFHSADSRIFIADGSNIVETTLDIFQVIEPAYTLPISPPDLTAQYYEPGRLHSLYAGQTQYAGAFPWTDGDYYISQVSVYLDKLKNPTQDLAIEKNLRLNELGTLYRSKMSGNLNLFSTVMPSNISLTADVVSYTQLTETPLGYYQRDIDAINVALTLSNLQTYQNGIVQLGFILRQNYDSISDAINACTTIEDVDAIDLTAGWPTLPYTPI